MPFVLKTILFWWCVGVSSVVILRLGIGSGLWNFVQKEVGHNLNNTINEFNKSAPTEPNVTRSAPTGSDLITPAPTDLNVTNSPAPGSHPRCQMQFT